MIVKKPSWSEGVAKAVGPTFGPISDGMGGGTRRCRTGRPSDDPARSAPSILAAASTSNGKFVVYNFKTGLSLIREVSVFEFGDQFFIISCMVGVGAGPVRAVLEHIPELGLIHGLDRRITKAICHLTHFLL